jgi:hypothetical protein
VLELADKRVSKTGLGWMRRFEKCWLSQQNMCRQIWPVYEPPKRVKKGFKVRKWSMSGYGWTAVRQVELADERPGRVWGVWDRVRFLLQNGRPGLATASFLVSNGEKVSPLEGRFL